MVEEKSKHLFRYYILWLIDFQTRVFGCVLYPGIKNAHVTLIRATIRLSAHKLLMSLRNSFEILYFSSAEVPLTLSITRLYPLLPCLFLFSSR